MVPILVRWLPIVQVDQHVRQVLVQSVLNVGRRASCRVILLWSLLLLLAVIPLVSMSLRGARGICIVLLVAAVWVRICTVVLLIHCSLLLIL